MAQIAMPVPVLTCMLPSNMTMVHKGDRQQYRAEVARSKLRRHCNTAKGRFARVVSSVDCELVSDTPLQDRFWKVCVPED